MKELLTDLLTKLNFLNDDQKISITNITVMTFVAITAFRALFGGSTIDTQYFKWQIQVVDYSTALTVLFSLWGYDRKRVALNTQINKENDKNL